MRLGIIAQQPLGITSEPPPEEEPDTSPASLSFDTQVYHVAGENVALADVFDHPENVVPGLGLILGYDYPGEILTPIADLLLAGDCTVRIEWWRVDDFAMPLRIGDSDASGTNPLISINDGDADFLVFDAFTHPALIERDLDSAGVGGTMVQTCVAMTRTDAKIVSSRSGAVIQSDTTANAASGLTNAFLGGYPGNVWPIIIRSIKVFATEEDAALPALADPGAALSVPPNDAFANAIEVFLDEYHYNVNTGATKQAGEPDHAGNAGGHSVWYKFTVPSDGDYTFIVWDGTIIDPLLAVYTGSAVGSLVEIESDAAFFYEVTVTGATTGTVYRIAVDGYDGQEGFISLRVTAA